MFSVCWQCSMRAVVFYEGWQCSMRAVVFYEGWQCSMRAGSVLCVLAVSYEGCSIL